MLSTALLLTLVIGAETFTTDELREIREFNKVKMQDDIEGKTIRVQGNPRLVTYLANTQREKEPELAAPTFLGISFNLGKQGSDPSRDVLNCLVENDLGDKALKETVKTIRTNDYVTVEGVFVSTRHFFQPPVLERCRVVGISKAK